MHELAGREPDIVIRVIGFEPAPWTAPQLCMTRRGQRFSKYRTRSDIANGRPNYPDWKRIVADAAREAMGGRRPFAGPIVMDMQLMFRAQEPSLIGEPCFPAMKWDKKKRAYKKPHLNMRPLPDTTNMSKSTEDALEGIVFHNDAQVVAPGPRRVWGEQGGCLIKVWTLCEPQEPPQETTPESQPHGRRTRKGSDDGSLVPGAG